MYTGIPRRYHRLGRHSYRVGWRWRDFREFQKLYAYNVAFHFLSLLLEPNINSAHHTTTNRLVFKMRINKRENLSSSHQIHLNGIYARGSTYRNGLIEPVIRNSAIQCCTVLSVRRDIGRQNGFGGVPIKCIRMHVRLVNEALRINFFCLVRQAARIVLPNATI